MQRRWSSQRPANASVLLASSHAVYNEIPRRGRSREVGVDAPPRQQQPCWSCAHQQQVLELRMRDIRTLSTVEVDDAARRLAASTDPVADLGLGFLTALLRAGVGRRRTVALVAGPPGLLTGVCVLSTAPRPLLRAALARAPGAWLTTRSAARRRTLRTLARLRADAPNGGALLALASDASGIDGLLAAALAELDDHDVRELAALAGDRAEALERSGFTPGPPIGSASTMRWTWS
jgi:hypothetical protein